MILQNWLSYNLSSFFRFLLNVASIMIWLAISFGASSAALATESSEAESSARATVSSEEIQRSIAILEDEQKRSDLIRLLKVIDVYVPQAADDAKSEAAAPEAIGAEEEPADSTIKTSLGQNISQIWRDLTTIGPGLRQAKKEMQDVFAALGQSTEIWQAYFFKIFLWGFICLLATVITVYKWGKIPDYPDDIHFLGRMKVVGIYLLKVGTPCLVLIVLVFSMPEISNTIPGITVDMATGFSLIHALALHFFANLSVLFLSLQLAKAIFSPDDKGRSISNCHPVLSRHCLTTWRYVAIYLALFIFIRETFLEHFVTGRLYGVIMFFLTIPIPIYLTSRLVKLHSIRSRINEAEISAAPSKDEIVPDSSIDALKSQAKTLDYPARLFFNRYWLPLSLIGIWFFSILAILNPADAAEQFAFRLLSSLILLLLAVGVIKISRLIFLKTISKSTKQGRKLLFNLDSLVTALAIIILTALVMSIWGVPLISLFEHEVTKQFFSRLIAIAIIIVALVIFLRFSHMVAQWLLYSPNLYDNRNWRTITPLIETTIRTLAIFVALVAILDRLGVNIGPILAGAGILGLGVGMGAQSLVKDVINGVSILLSDTLAVGDNVTIGGMSGKVASVGLRNIRLRDANGALTVVPNSSVTSIVNSTRDYSQDVINLVVPYDADPDQMLQLAKEVADQLSQDPAWKNVQTSPVEVLGVTNFSPDGTTIQLKVNTLANQQWAIGRELRLRLKRRMLKEGYTSTWFGSNVTLFKGDPDQTTASPASKSNDDNQNET